MTEHHTYRDDGDPAFLRHAWARLVLHELRLSGERSNPLLLLHGAGERTDKEIPHFAEAWGGDIYGLDFTGHGESSRTRGGGFVSEYLVGDVDIALARIGPATIVGRGLGAWIGLLVAGARPELVRGLVLCDGPGLAGGGDRAGVRPIAWPLDAAQAGDADPYAAPELDAEWRFPEVAVRFAEGFTKNAATDRPLAVCTDARPPWLAAVVDAVAVWITDPLSALAHFTAR
ncbi:MAG: alpha/beta hydrolase [Acidimicrobiia bacterium]